MTIDYADVCYECTGYGDDYSMSEDGEMVNNCSDCWVTLSQMEEDE